MSSTPTISVVMPVYNGSEYLASAIESVLNQTYTDFEFIIIDDGSTDDSIAIIEAYAKNDDRIKVLQNGQNKGTVYTLNRGLDSANGKYIAIIHADDKASPDRLEKQWHFMEVHPKISILGGQMILSNNNKSTTHPTHPNAIKMALVAENVLMHPTIIMRKADLLEKNLRYVTGQWAEDYKMWCDASINGLNIANLPTVLGTYRIHPKQATNTLKNEIAPQVVQIKQEYARALLGNALTDEEVEIITGNKVTSLNGWYTLINKLKESNRNNPLVSSNDLDILRNKKIETMLKKAYFQQAKEVQTTSGEKIKLYALNLKRSINKILK